MAKIAILGVGKMGSAMAKELAAANHEVILWNRTNEKAIELAKITPNTIVASSVKEALKNADVALCLFVSGEVTENALLGDASILSEANKSIVIADMGTSGVSSAKKLGAAISQAGLKFVDAPVSGSIATIAAHQLLVMASGDYDDVSNVEPILMSFSKKVLHVGGIGAGQAMKLAVNLIVHSLNSAVSESLALATSAGVAPEKVYEVFEESVIAAPFVKYKKGTDMSGIYKTSRGQAIDLDRLKLINQTAIAVGNAGTNARGDLVQGGKIVKTREQLAQEHYNISGNNIVKDQKVRRSGAEIQPDTPKPAEPVQITDPFEDLKNPYGIGIEKAKGIKNKKYHIEDIINGKHLHYPLHKFKNKLFDSGYVPKVCGSCGFSEERITDGKMPLARQIP